LASLPIKRLRKLELYH